MDPKRLLLHMSFRMYEDIKFVTEQNPTQIVDEDGTRAYNNLLAKTRRYFQLTEFTNDFNEWAPRTIKYKDALVVVGQLYSMIEALSGAPPPRSESRPPMPAAPPLATSSRGTTQRPPSIGSPSEPIPQKAATSSDRVPLPSGSSPSVDAAAQPHSVPDRPKSISSEQVHRLNDEELYGPNPQPRSNDGTIPFRLD